MPEPIPYEVYISGPMTGLPNYNYDEFHRVADWLVGSRVDFAKRHKLKKGTMVFPLNPARNFGGDQTLPRERYLALAVEQVKSAQAILLIDGWEYSEGARLELETAITNGLDIYEWWEDLDSFKVERRTEAWVRDRLALLDTYQKLMDTMPPWQQAKAEAGEPFLVREPEQEDIELEARRLVRNGQRQKNYGHPRGDFDTIARYWSNHLGHDVTAEDVAIMMTLLKLARLKSNPQHHDSRVDGIGYLICLDRLDEPQEAA